MADMLGLEISKSITTEKSGKVTLEKMSVNQRSTKEDGDRK